MNVTPIFMHHYLIEYREKVFGNEGVWKKILARRYKPSADEHGKRLVKLYTQMPSHTHHTHNHHMKSRDSDNLVGRNCSLLILRPSHYRSKRCRCALSPLVQCNPCQCSYHNPVPGERNFITMFMPCPACPPWTPSVHLVSPYSRTYPAKRTKAFIVPCRACLWFRRNLGSVPLRDGYLLVFGFLILWGASMSAGLVQLYSRSSKMIGICAGEIVPVSVCLLGLHVRGVSICF